jgi:putative nucleotidyltransferase with HDIG domain
MIAKTFTMTTEPPGATAGEAGTRAHCRRVAAWCAELGRANGLKECEAAALQEAALLHHEPDLLRGQSFARLMGDLGVESNNAYSDSPGAGAALLERVLSAFHGCRFPNGDRQAQELAQLLDAANCFDEQLEHAPFEHEGIEKVLEQALEVQRHADEAVAYVIHKLRKASRADLLQVLPKLPVYPAIAMRLYRLLACDDVSLGNLESIARADQVVAGKLVKAANSVYYSPWQPIKSVAQAISYVGTEDSRRILLASSIQPLFSSPRLRKLWKHALEAAQIAETIAELSGKVDPAEAFLLGLLHDVGKLALSLMSKDINEAIERLLEKGCQPATAELVLCGFDHAEAGGEVMRYWKFSEDLIAAVQYHHQPERVSSEMAGVLYLTEFWTDSEEDLPSNARLYAAMKLTGLTPEVLEAARMSVNGAISTL